MANAAPRTYTGFMAESAGRRDDDLSYSPLPRPRRKEQGKSALPGLAAVSLLAVVAVYLQFPAPAPTVVEDPAPAVTEQLPPPEAAIAPALETGAVATPAVGALTAPVTENPSEAVFTHYTTEPGAVSRAVVRIDGKIVLRHQLFRKKSEGGTGIRAMPASQCVSGFLMRAGGKPIYKDVITAALPAARRYSLEVRWYDADGDELSRDAYDVDGKKAISRQTVFRISNAPRITESRIGGLLIESGGTSTPNANSMVGAWNTPKRPRWQPELPKQASFFSP